MKKSNVEYYGTLGPSCIGKDILKEMFACGMTGIRLNLSHGSLKDREEWIHIYKEAAEESGIQADLLIDLIGPEIRIGEVEPALRLIEGDEVCLGEDGIPVPDYIVEIIEPGMEILLDDGKIELFACENKKNRIICKVRRGGLLHSRKSLALPGVKVNNPTLTKQDVENLSLANKYGVTAVMLPFVRGKEDLGNLKKVLEEKNCSHIRIFAKIENMEGVEKVGELLPHCDVIVIARGDLGNAMALTHLPVVQQQISDICKKEEKPFMVVTQMLNSMMDSSVPTRAEVTDIFHAIQNGASSVMLTGETAAGKYPVEAMRVLVDTGEEAVRYLQTLK